MTEVSSVAMWACMTSWFTPTSLFLFLNLMIGTIVLTSRFTSQKNPPQQLQDNPGHPLFRSPSLLDRVKSINFSLYRSESSEAASFFQHSEVAEQTQYTNSDHAPPHQLTRAPSLLERVKSFNFSFPRFEHSESAGETPYSDLITDPVSDHYTDNLVAMSKPESVKAPEKKKKKKSDSETPVSSKVPAKMKKSASEKFGFGRAEEDENVERRRPATVREEKKKKGDGSETGSTGDEECVNAKADDFINKFRQQLKLQRLDSLLRYKEMITGGSSK